MMTPIFNNQGIDPFNLIDIISLTLSLRQLIENYK